MEIAPHYYSWYSIFLNIVELFFVPPIDYHAFIVSSLVKAYYSSWTLLFSSAFQQSFLFKPPSVCKYLNFLSISVCETLFSNKEHLLF